MIDYEIIIAGGGPIGCFIAKKLASQGIRVAIMEEHEKIGEPLHCAGLVTPRVFNISQCSKTGIVQNKIYGAYIHNLDGTILTIGGNKMHALVINRPLFDQKLADAAHSAKADLFTSHKIVSAKKDNKSIILTIQHNNHIKTKSCRLLIGADGSSSLIRNSFNFPHPLEILYGIGAELSATNLDPFFVHIYVGHTLAPGFFAWVIPTNKHGTTARIGLCIQKKTPYSLQHYFTNLLQQPILQGAIVMRRFGGTIPLGSLKKTVDDNIMLVGDSAAQVKPISGGGLYPGLLCATCCTNVAEEAVQRHTFNTYLLKQYHTKWKKEIGHELSLGMRFRKAFTNLTDDHLIKYQKKLNNKKIIEIINNYGDIDYPSRVVIPLLKASPSLLTLAPALLKNTKK